MGPCTRQRGPQPLGFTGVKKCSGCLNGESNDDIEILFLRTKLINSTGYGGRGGQGRLPLIALLR